LGLSSALYHLYNWSLRGTRSLYKYFKSIFNSKKYLDSASQIVHTNFGVPNPSAPNDSTGRAYALIYGASTRAASTFAHYLLDKGFNLILIERDIQPLNDLENSLREQFSSSINLNNAKNNSRIATQPI
jgi:hypothetical protein